MVVFRGRSRQPRPAELTLRVPQCYGLAPDPRAPGAVALEQRGEIGRTWGPWDAEMAATYCLLEAFQISRNKAFFSFFCNSDGIIYGRFLTRKNEKKQVTSAFQKSRTDTLPFGTITDHTITRCFLPDCQVPRFASTRLVSLRLASPLHTHSHSGVSSLQGSCCYCCCCCCCCCCYCGAGHPITCRCSKPQVIHGALSIPFGRSGLA
jgi:hypothetical protein